jgi:hypothetical protein
MFILGLIRMNFSQIQIKVHINMRKISEYLGKSHCSNNEKNLHNGIKSHIHYMILEFQRWHALR